MAHRPRHSGGFSSGQSVIGSPQSSVNQGPPGSGPGSQGFSPFGGFSNPQEQAAQSMISQGITSLSGTTGGSQGQQAAQQQQDQGYQTIQQAAQQANQLDQVLKDIGITKDEDEVKDEVKDEGEGLQDIFLNKIFGSQINRLTPKEMKRAKSILSQYISLGETNPLKLRALMTSNVLGGLFGKDQRFSDMDGNIIDEKDIVFKDGQMFTKDGKPIRTTKEGTIDLLKEEIGSEGIQSLKKFNPELYYPFQGMPQTTGGLEDLAKLDTKGLEGTNPDLVKMIFDARATLDQNKGNQGGGGAGIPSLPQFQDKMDITKPSLSSQYSMIPEQYMGFFNSPFNKPVAGGMAITPVQLPDGSTIQFGDTGSAAQFQQYLDSIGVNYSNPGIVEKIANTPATGIPSLTPTTIDYASMGPQYGGYVNQGISDPRFASYFQNLQMFPRRS